MGSSAATASIPGKASAPGVSGASTSHEKGIAELTKTIGELSSKVDNLGAAVNEQAHQTNNLRGAFDRNGLGYGQLGWGGNGLQRRAYAK